jgi:hypothetical protein
MKVQATADSYAPTPNYGDGESDYAMFDIETIKNSGGKETKVSRCLVYEEVERGGKSR